MIVSFLSLLIAQSNPPLVALDNPGALAWWSTAGATTSFDPQGRGMTVDFGTTEWPSVTYKPYEPLNFSTSGSLMVRVVNLNAFDVTLGIRMDDNDPSADGYNHSRQGMIILPAGRTMDVAANFGMDPKFYGMRGLPGQPGIPGVMATGAFGWDSRFVSRIQLFLHRPPRPTRLIVNQLRLLPRTPMKGIVDAYGQFTRGEWPGKLKSDEAWKGRIQIEEQDIKAQPQLPDRSRFGGWMSGPKLKATGFFRTEKIDDRWWLVDPEGHPYFSVGSNVVSSNLRTFTTGRETMFSALPTASDTLGEFIADDSTSHGGAKTSGKTFNFYEANLSRKYGKTWRKAWADRTLRRFASWGFNTVANWSDESVAPNGKVPYVQTVWIEGKHQRVASGNDYWSKMHDPFDPEFRTSVQAAVARLEKTKMDPYCLGTFVDNELSWSGSGPDDGRYGLAVGTLALGSDSPAKRAFVELLHERYSTIETLERAWETKLGSWEQLAQPQKGPWLFSTRQCTDMGLFVAAFSAKYHSIVREELKKVDPNHLYLGCRFAWFGKDAVKAAAEFTDVLSFNVYQPELLRSKWDWLKDLNKPAIIGEFHFGALDRGLFHPGLVDAGTQSGRAKMYSRYVSSVAELPFMVGCHWFQYVDEPLTGRVLDGENYQIGLVDVTDTPYSELIGALRRTHSLVYDLHAKSK